MFSGVCICGNVKTFILFRHCLSIYSMKSHLIDKNTLNPLKNLFMINGIYIMLLIINKFSKGFNVFSLHVKYMFI